MRTVEMSKEIVSMLQPPKRISVDTIIRRVQLILLVIALINLIHAMVH